MFIGEVGIDPRIGDGGRGYRRRVAGLIAAGRAWARFERGQVMFKAEVGSQSPAVGQIQGVWVHPDWRGRGIGTAGTAALAAGGGAQRPHREPVRQQLQHRRPGHLRADRIQRGRHRSPPFCSTDLRRAVYAWGMTEHDTTARSGLSPTRSCTLSPADTRCSTPSSPPRTTTRPSKRSPTSWTRPTAAAEAVLRLSFDRLTKVSRRRIAAELENLTSQELTFHLAAARGSARR